MKCWILSQRAFALVALLSSLPFFGLLWLAVKLEDGGGLLYKQKRMGKDRKPFAMFKFRTMVKGAERLKTKYEHLNEADGPVFKIYKDPRHTRVGRFLAHTGLDELPQLVNVIEGNMAFVGPRPLPWDEAKKIPKKYQNRFSVLPGITSSWVIKGAHRLNFRQWMELDLEDIEKGGVVREVHVGLRTAILSLRLLYARLRKYTLPLMVFLLIFFGFCWRLRLALGRSLWVDEVFYFHIANTSSFKDLLFVNHWIKDDPPLFLIFLKIWSSVNKSVLWLRLPGLIIYAVSAYLLVNRLFKRLPWMGRVTVLVFFVLSTFFININYWITPYNFVLIATLLQLDLLRNYLGGKFEKRKTSFVVWFGLLNLLMFNFHYTAFCFFLACPLVLAYLFLAKRKLARIFFFACAFSGLLLIPNLLLLLNVWPGFIRLMRVSPVDVYFTTLFELFLYIIGRSILRLRSYLLTGLALFILGAILVRFWATRPKKKIDDFFPVVSISLFAAPALFLYFAYSKYPSTLIERTFSIYHLAFYFLLAFVLMSIFRASKSLHRFVCACFTSIAILLFLLGVQRGTNDWILAGDAAFGHLNSRDYGHFLDRADSILKEYEDRVVVVLGNNEENQYERYIFQNYYFPFDNRFKKPRKKLVLNETLFFADGLSGLEDTQFLNGKKTIILNFERKLEKEEFLSQAKDYFVDKPVVVDFWSYFEHPE